MEHGKDHQNPVHLSQISHMASWDENNISDYHRVHTHVVTGVHLPKVVYIPVCPEDISENDSLCFGI